MKHLLRLSSLVGQPCELEVEISAEVDLHLTLDEYGYDVNPARLCPGLLIDTKDRSYSLFIVRTTTSYVVEFLTDTIRMTKPVEEISEEDWRVINQFFDVRSVVATMRNCLSTPDNIQAMA